MEFLPRFDQACDSHSWRHGMALRIRRGLAEISCDSRSETYREKLMPRKNVDLHGTAPDKCETALFVVDVINDLDFPEATKRPNDAT